METEHRLRVLVPAIRSMVAAMGSESSRRLLDASVLGHPSSFISTRSIL